MFKTIFFPIMLVAILFSDFVCAENLLITQYEKKISQTESDVILNANLESQSIFKKALLAEVANIKLENESVVADASHSVYLNYTQRTVINDSIQRLNGIESIINLKLSNPKQDILVYSWGATTSNSFIDNSAVVLSQPESSFKIEMLEGQREPFSFILENLSDNDIIIDSISIDVADKNNKRFPSAALDVLVVKTWFMGSKSSINVESYQLTHPIVVSELLIYDDSLIYTNYGQKKNFLKVFESNQTYYQDISTPSILMPSNAQVVDSVKLRPFVINKYKAKQIWVTINSNGVSSGHYSGAIKVSYFNKFRKVSKTPLNIDVVNLQLGRSKLIYGVYYASQIRENYGLKSIQKNFAQYRSELENLIEHNVLYPTLYIGGDDESTIANYLRIRQSVGLPCDKIFFIYGLGNSNYPIEELESHTKVLQRLVAQNTACPHSKIHYYGIDEATGNKLVAESIQWQKIHELGGYVYTSTWAGDIAKNKLESYIDVLNFGASLYNPNSRDIKKMNAIGKDIFLYNLPQSGVPDFNIYRQNYGFYLIKHGFTGAMDFAYQISFPVECGSDQSIGKKKACDFERVPYHSAWNNFDSNKFYDHMFTYPTSNGVIDTVQWEGYAAAITDTRYYYTLVDLMKSKCKKNNKRCNFDPMSLIDVDDPAGTRQRIMDKIKLLVGNN